MKNVQVKNGRPVDSRLLSYVARVIFIAALVGLIGMIGMQSCSRSSSFEGTFVNSAGSEFSLANDTLIVEHVEGNLYAIHRRTGFRLLDEKGVPGKQQWEKEEWTADYDAESGLMSEKRHGKSIAFNASHSVMTVGRRKYQRVD